MNLWCHFLRNRTAKSSDYTKYSTCENRISSVFANTFNKETRGHIRQLVLLFQLHHRVTSRNEQGVVSFKKREVFLSTSWINSTSIRRRCQSFSYQPRFTVSSTHSVTYFLLSQHNLIRVICQEKKKRDLKIFSLDPLLLVPFVTRKLTRGSAFYLLHDSTLSGGYLRQRAIWSAMIVWIGEAWILS